jgi:hypothetical protein
MEHATGHDEKLRIRADEHRARRTRESARLLCERCDAPLKSPREQSSRLCGWCEGSVSGFE